MQKLCHHIQFICIHNYTRTSNCTIFVRLCTISIAEIARTRMRPEMRAWVQLTVRSLNMNAEFLRCANNS